MTLTPEQWQRVEEIRALPFEERRLQWSFPERVRRADLPPTRREIEVLTLVAEGFTNAEIARQIVVTEETVKSHLQNLTAKLGARKRAHMVALGFRRGYLI